MLLSGIFQCELFNVTERPKQAPESWHLFVYTDLQYHNYSPDNENDSSNLSYCHRLSLNQSELAHVISFWYSTPNPKCAKCPN